MVTLEMMSPQVGDLAHLGALVSFYFLRGDDVPSPRIPFSSEAGLEGKLTCNK